LGRPLSRRAGAGYVEEALPQDPLELLRLGIEHFNAQRFFQAHETWESAWHPAPDPERDFWQGVTQIAVGFTHLQRGNLRGAATLLRRGAARLDKSPDGYKSFPVERVVGAARAAADQIEQGRQAELPSI
jgi:hypothetical protein